MNNFVSTSFVVILLAFSVTDSEAFPFKKFPFKFDLSKFLKTLAVITTKAPTTPPTTTTTTTTPPPTTVHPDDKIIALCTATISKCPWSVAELAKKIVERRNIDKNATSNGTGKSSGPKVNPNSVGDKPKKVIVKPSKGLFGGSSIKAVGSTTYAIPAQCTPFGEKHQSTGQYKINCVDYMYDYTIANYDLREQYMIGCFKCRNLVELGNAVRYV